MYDLFIISIPPSGAGQLTWRGTAVFLFFCISVSTFS